ncbi:FAD-dependent oxidoreductase [Embleya scabrispora]|uniref:FAD-dependent oxidoreductase n=1 Tax=Embleya scabrispora TaxID=159449 RepID=UPI0003601694|nr:FAD-dependent oxidoreductase [Embleya scabrispora]MYS80351.1 FAD-dependent oxidoreductase [Streptomyces sp. SID5474]
MEAASGERLVIRTGGLDLAREGTGGHEILSAYHRSLDAAAIAYDVLDVAQLRAGWPQWNVPNDTVALHQADAGLVDIRRATAAHTRLARQHGVDVLSDCTVLGIDSTAGGVRVKTGRGEFSAGSLVVCAGSWLGGLLDKLGDPFRIELTQEQVQYFHCTDPDAFTPDRFPVWIWHGDSDFYGLPVYGERAVKVARDMTGRFVTSQTRSFDADPAETELVRSFLRLRLPAWAGPTALAKTCVYDLPRDRELVIGDLPGHPRVFVAVGAGHAGKFAALIGRVLADLVLDGRTPFPIDAFRADRPSLRADAPALYRLGTGSDHSVGPL